MLAVIQHSLGSNPVGVAVEFFYFAKTNMSENHSPHDPALEASVATSDHLLPVTQESIDLARNSQVGQAIRKLNHMYPINFSISAALTGASAMRRIPTLTGIALRYAKN